MFQLGSSQALLLVLVAIFAIVWQQEQGHLSQERTRRQAVPPVTPGGQTGPAGGFSQVNVMSPEKGTSARTPIYLLIDTRSGHPETQVRH